MISNLGLLFGTGLLTFNVWRLITIWAANTPGIQWVYWITLAFVFLAAIWSTTAPGRNALAGKFSPTTIALIGFVVLFSLTLSLFTV